MTLKVLDTERPSALVTVAVMVAVDTEGEEPQAGAVQVTSLEVLVVV